MRPIPITAISVLSALGLAVGTAVAQQTPDVQGLDPSQQIPQPSAQELMSEYDQDGNQSLSEEEFSSLYQERLQASSGQAGAQGDQQAAPQQGQQGAELASQVFGNLDRDGNSELDATELAAVTALIGAASGQPNAATGQQDQDLNPQVGTTTQSPAGAQSSENSTLFAGEVRTSPRDIGEDTSGQGTSLTGQASGASQVGQPAQTAPDSRQSAQPGAGNDAPAIGAVGQPGQDTQDQQTPQGEFGQQQGAQQGQFGQTQGQSQLEQMANAQPDQLRGMSVRSPQGGDLGEIEEVVRDRDDGELYAVIASGGFFGIGADRSAVRLSELEMEDDAIVYSSTPDQLEQQPYEESRFEPVESGESQAGTTEEPLPEQPA